MAQRDKVKELVGRGLNSYHTKALQQIDRIEKKNKEQNHKISILSNELDNDYLTKTEEGSVISLEHSKEGMIYLDELQGNTLVNYCTDGSKEMTLNGDIDVEGTSVTLTEGVDNGKVDVMCEGNTLVNKLYKIKDYGSITEFVNHGWNSAPTNSNYEWIDNGIKMKALSSDTQLDRYYRSSPEKYGIFKKNRTYVVRMNVSSNDLQQNASILRCFYGNGRTFITGEMTDVVDGVFVKKGTTSSEIEEVDAIHSMISLDYRTPSGVEGWVSFSNVMVIDVTDLPSYQQDVEYWRNIEYFEGMKSVGQDDENGHKIEILSQNKNLLKLYDTKKSLSWNGITIKILNNNEILINGTCNSDYTWVELLYDFQIGTNPKIDKIIPLNKNFKYTLSTNIISGTVSNLDFISFAMQHKNIETAVSCNSSNNFSTTFGNADGAYRLWVTIKENATFNNCIISLQLEEGEIKTPYIINTQNKKEILLNEPLRGLPNGIKDRFVKIGGKFYIERNCVAITLNETYNWAFNNTDGTTTNRYILDLRPILPTLSDGQDIRNTLCDKCVTSQWSQTLELGVSRTGDTLFAYNKSCATLAEFKNWIANNNLNLIMKLAAPIYEPLEIEPTLNTYNDMTHISNNSIIPCNMKIKNSGYNAIIKPSTLYTVALDTNKNGTVGMNLGGAKATTTNNVLKLTTPATLTDDSLRLYGKGIKGSKVRLLEGDKTNWIPSHFEGIKSCFEDKLQDDGTYKMEILMNNKNLFDISTYYSGTANIEFKDNGFRLYTTKPMTYANAVFKIKVKPFTNYKIYTDKKVVSGNTLMDVYDKSNKWLANTDTTFNSKDNMELSFRFYCSSDVSVIGDVQYSNVRLIEIGNNTDFVEHKHNKIQFSSIEPLRSVENTKDKFVFKDGKLMIERNCGAFKINSSQGFIRASKYDNGYLYGFEKDFNEIKRVLQSNKTIKCDKLPYYPYIGGNIAMKNINGEWIGTWSNKIDRSVIMLRLKTKDNTLNSLNEYLKENPIEIVYIKIEPTYEEIPFELQKIILEGYENGTLFFDTNIPPTVTTTYAGETPIVKATKLNKTEVLNNTNDINDNIVPYLMDMDYRVVCLQLQSETSGLNMTRLFGGAYEMLQRDIQSKRYSVDEYRHRLDAYLGANKITEDEYNKLGDMLND